MSRVTSPAKARQEWDPSLAQRHAAGNGCTQPHRPHTSVAAAGIKKPAGVPNSVFDAGRMAKPPGKPRCKARPQAEQLQSLTAAVVESGIPMQRKPANRSVGEAYARLLGGMSEGDSVVLPESTGKGLLTYGRKRGVRMQCRTVASGMVRVWRLAGAAS